MGTRTRKLCWLLSLVSAVISTVAAASPATAAAFKTSTAEDKFSLGEKVLITVMGDPKLVNCVGARIVRAVHSDGRNVEKFGEYGLRLISGSAQEKADDQPGDLPDPKAWVRVRLVDGIGYVTLDSSAATAAGEASPDAPRRPQEIKVAVLLKPMNGHGPARTRSQDLIAPETINISFNTPLGTLGVDHTHRHTVRLERSFPWSAATGKAALLLMETSGKTDLKELEVRPLSPHGKNGRPPSEGETTVEADANLASPDLAANRFLVTAGATQRIGLSFAKFRRAGEHEVDLLLTSPNLEKPVLLPFAVTVTDHWLLPVLIITLGVLGAFAIGYLAERIPAGEELRVALSEINGSAESLARRLEKAGAATSGTKSGAAREARLAGAADRLQENRLWGQDTADEADDLSRSVRVARRKNFSFALPKGPLITEGQRVAEALEMMIGRTEADAKLASLRSADQTETAVAPDLDLVEAKRKLEVGKLALRDSRKRLEDSDLQLSQVALTLAALLLAILTGVEQLYLGTTFGTGKQYLGAFIWGFGAQAGLSAVVGLVKRLLPSGLSQRKSHMA